MRSKAERVLLLAGSGTSTNIVCHALRARFGQVHVVIEERVSRRQLLSRRLKKLGAARVAGQVAFMATALPLLNRLARQRLDEIARVYELDSSPIHESITRVSSANSEETLKKLRSLSPDVVVVNGTRILSTDVLNCTPATFINMHAGITPFCRGVHGGYWALADQRPELVGTTVHLVDSGIDTGKVIAQATFEPTSRDSFATYPLLHTAVGLPLLLDAVEAALEGRLEHQAPLIDGPSKLRTHPTLLEYAWRRFSQGVA